MSWLCTWRPADRNDSTWFLSSKQSLLFSRYFLSQALRMDAPMAPSDRSDLRSLDLPDIRQVKGVIDLQLFDFITILEDTNRFVCSKT